MSGQLVGLIPPGTPVRYAGGEFILIRRHRGAPKGKVAIELRHPALGVGQVTLDDTDRLELA